MSYNTPVVAPATRTHQPPQIRQWDYVYLRTSPLASSEGQAGGASSSSGTRYVGSLVDSLQDPRYLHWALQVRQCVYDLSRGNDDNNDPDDRTPVYYPKLVHEWEAIHSGHTKKPVGITFWSNQTIDKLAHIRWSSDYREQYVLTYQNCQHFAIQLLFSIHATSEEMMSIPANVLASLTPLPQPIRADARTTNALRGLRNKNIEPIEGNFLADEKPYCGYHQLFVDRYVRMGYSVENVTILLQRLGVKPLVFGFAQPVSSVTPDVERTLLDALEGKIRVGEQGNIE